ncbi:hypothetical protein SU69_08830 [Thermosipho melanesiensis]|uniref:Tfp pilus assembly protein ATPase PilM-like protein n=2 Tax=Thermosipho melanesiensis TaxID=46541 RepID=A6LNT5_THEM4|nr:hypothetical protein [Thermosipho melanesiensis]ABR31586.1 hypothetical protein Tmel_1747 [Thermosipho melanesiensis BI429]APT74950.1 hypothetical protein BW47_09205 [Thermosipho melanesiensis]OOC35322.1 hypothetical protein SU69_08830 [Thermosipho melanesiensis]OOC35540.1 hypothetical protein SU70_08840 [Thermosipho melanesiensis]OOC36577.1 hypothetical protein SU68_08895 [Thermosipho melanesiensis]
MIKELLGRRVIAVDFHSENDIYFGALEYFFGKSKVLFLKDWESTFEITVDDFVIVNIPWDYILNLKIDLPSVKNKKELEKLILLEISQSLGVQPNEFFFDYILNPNGKANVFIIKKEDFHAYFQVLSQRNIPEPDVVYPDFLKESLMFNKLPGYNIQFFINKNSSGILVFNNSELMEIRYSDFNLNNLSGILLDELGYTLYELEYLDDEDLINDGKTFITGIFNDLLSLIEREIFVTVNSMDEKIGIDSIQTIQIVTDSNILNEFIRERYTESSLLLNRFYFQDLSKILRNYRYLGVLGLLKRGGINFGKVELV